MNTVFIGGCGRSGTTLLGSLLGAHSACIAVPESQFKFHLLDEFPALRRSPDDVRAFLGNHWRYRTWGLNSDTLRGIERYESVRELLFHLVRSYGDMRLNKQGAVWVDHTPDNFDHALPLIRHFPEAKFIHIVRDGRGVAASVLPLPWGPNTIKDAAEWWIRRIAVGIAAEQYFGDQRILRVYYRDLVRQPREVVGRIQNFLGLDREEVIIDNRDSFQLPTFTRDQHALVHKAPDPARERAWQKTLTRREIELFELQAGVLLSYLGFNLLCSSVRSETNIEALKFRIVNTWKRYKGAWISARQRRIPIEQSK